MPTQAQIEANRRNAEKSTGPRTPEGKARSRRNATRHRLCSDIVLMPDEEKEFRDDFNLLLADLREEHHPDGPTEDILVFKMAESVFFTNRASALLAEKLEENDIEDATKDIALMLRYHTTSDRAFSKHLHDLRKLQKERALEEIGFVPQNAEPAPAAEPEKPAAISRNVEDKPDPRENPVETQPETVDSAPDIPEWPGQKAA
jgi:hypothetical protein